MSANKTLLLLIALFALTFINVQATGGYENCAAVAVNETALFYLCPFARLDPFTVHNDTLGDISFTLGTAHTPNCQGSANNVWGTLKYPDIGQECNEIAVDNPNITLYDPTNDQSGILIDFPHNNNSVYSRHLVVYLKCDANMSANATTVFDLDSYDDNTITVIGASSYGCPYATLSQLFAFLTKYKYPFIGIAVILGLFVSFFGLKMFNPSIFIITTILGTICSGMFFFEFVKFGSQTWILWIIFGACLIIGLVLGYLAITYEKVGFFALGAALGVVGGLLLYSAVISQFANDSKVFFYVVVVICGLIVGGIAVWLWKSVVIIATSFIGSYMIVRALSVIIGGFPNEQAVAEGVEPLSAVAYLYIVAIVAFAILAMWVQFRDKRKREEEDDEEDAVPKKYLRYEN